MGGATEPRLLYWRVILVGWGTVLGTAIFVSAVLVLLSWDARILPILGVYSIALAAIISVVFAVPMLVIWVPLFGLIRKNTASIRRAAIITTTVLAAFGTILLAVVMGLATQNIRAVLSDILPWMPVPMAIAACLASYAFDTEEVMAKL